MKRMLINATQSEELRVAVVDGQKLLELEIEFSLRPERKGNIYKGIITRVEPSLDAVFVDYGEERHGFLPYKEISRIYYNDKKTLVSGQALIVQVTKDERGNKGAALSTYISLAGRYVVLMPMSPRTGGVSRRADSSTRVEMRETLELLDVPADMGIIVRTAGIGRDAQDLNWDLNYLKQLWEAITGAAKQNNTPELIYQESNLIIRAIRDYFEPSINEILIDTQDVYNQAAGFMSYVMPSYGNRVKLYDDSTPLFSRFQVEHQIETVYARTVNLPSGGSIVVDRTEALVAIDINSARSTRGQDVEQTAFTTNMEAAEEISRQLRLRDLGGLIVIDFIDMDSSANQREIETKMREFMRSDRARIQIAKLSRFGLLEISRQRLQPSLGESSNVVCSRCAGAGSIRSTDSFALQAIREIEDEALKENSGRVTIQVPVEVASFLLNEKRTDIQRIEIRSGVKVIVIPNKYLETPHYHIERLRHDELNEISDIKNSYQLIEENKPVVDSDNRLTAMAKQQKPIVKGMVPDKPAPEIKVDKKNKAGSKKTAKVAKSGGLIAWLKSLFFSDNSKNKGKPKKSNKGEIPMVSKGAGGRGKNPNRDNKNRGRNNANAGNRPRTNDNKDMTVKREGRVNNNRKANNVNKIEGGDKVDKKTIAKNNINTRVSKNDEQEDKNQKTNSANSPREGRDKEGSRSRYLGRNRDKRDDKPNKNNTFDNSIKMGEQKSDNKIEDIDNSSRNLPMKSQDELPVKKRDELPMGVALTGSVETKDYQKLDNAIVSPPVAEIKKDSPAPSAVPVVLVSQAIPTAPTIPTAPSPSAIYDKKPTDEIVALEKPVEIKQTVKPVKAVSKAPVANFPSNLQMVETSKSADSNVANEQVNEKKLGREIVSKNTPAQSANTQLNQIETKNI